MDKQECLEILNQKIDEAQEETDRSPEGSSYGTLMLGRKQAFSNVRGLLKTLDEPEKPEIPLFIATMIEYSRDVGLTTWDIINVAVKGKSDDARVLEWLQYNGKKFMQALVNGYTVKKPVWVVKDYDLYLKNFEYYDDEVTRSNFEIASKGDEDVLQYSEKEKAEAVALLVDGTVEEWSEKDE